MRACAGPRETARARGRLRAVRTSPAEGGGDEIAGSTAIFGTARQAGFAVKVEFCAEIEPFLRDEDPRVVHSSPRPCRLRCRRSHLRPDRHLVAEHAADVAAQRHIVIVE